jgi:hypothetical protein
MISRFVRKHKCKYFTETGRQLQVDSMECTGIYWLLHLFFSPLCICIGKCFLSEKHMGICWENDCLGITAEKGQLASCNTFEAHGMPPLDGHIVLQLIIQPGFKLEHPYHSNSFPRWCIISSLCTQTPEQN